MSIDFQWLLNEKFPEIEGLNVRVFLLSKAIFVERDAISEGGFPYFSTS